MVVVAVTGAAVVRVLTRMQIRVRGVALVAVAEVFDVRAHVRVRLPVQLWVCLWVRL